MSMAAIIDDAWQALATREAAREIGRWLEGRGRLHQPIAALSLGELECMAAASISRFLVLAMEWIREQTEGGEALTALLLPQGRVPSVAGRTGASATPTSSDPTVIPATASARCAASAPARRLPGGTTA